MSPIVLPAQFDSAIGQRKSNLSQPPCQSGFTLLEVLIVLVVVGILTTMAGSILLPGFEQRRMRASLETLADQMAFAQHRAILSGRPYGVVVDETGYVFVMYRNQLWEPAYEASIQATSLSNLVVHNEDDYGVPGIFRERNDTGIDKDDVLQPGIIFSPIGEPLPVDLRLSEQGKGWRLLRDDDDVIKIIRWQIADG